MFALDELELGLRELEAQMAAWLVKVGAYDRSGEWSSDGFASAAAALRHRCQLNVGVARGHVQLARKLEKLPVVAEAFGQGEISRAHASVIAEAYTRRIDRNCLIARDTASENGSVSAGGVGG
jgi:hypothetical protein